MTSGEATWISGIPPKWNSFGEVHVWRASLTLTAHQKKELMSLLSQDELARVRRFHFQRDQDRFIAARGILRRILAHYLEGLPQKLAFDYTDNGKPVLPQNNALRFNLSHSGAFALYAICQNKNVGIDMEHVRENMAIVKISQKFFSKNELRSLLNEPEEKQKQVFFQYWTRKEAVLKATGEGISFPMEQFDVSFLDGRMLAPIAMPGENKTKPRWYVRDLYPGGDYVAALAVEGADWNISCWNYTH